MRRAKFPRLYLLMFCDLRPDVVCARNLLWCGLVWYGLLLWLWRPLLIFERICIQFHFRKCFLSHSFGFTVFRFTLSSLCITVINLLSAWLYTSSSFVNWTYYNQGCFLSHFLLGKTSGGFLFSFYFRVLYFFTFPVCLCQWPGSFLLFHTRVSLSIFHIKYTVEIKKKNCIKLDTTRSSKQDALRAKERALCTSGYETQRCLYTCNNNFTPGIKCLVCYARWEIRKSGNK